MRTSLLILTTALLAATACSSDPEPQVPTDKGQIIVHLSQLVAEGETDDIDFSDYGVAITAERGFGYSAAFKDITWPIEVFAGTYTISAASPKVSETATTESYYYGEIKNVKIQKDQTVELTIPLTLTEYPKD